MPQSYDRFMIDVAAQVGKASEGMGKLSIWGLALIVAAAAASSRAAPSSAPPSKGSISIEEIGADRASTPLIPSFRDAVQQGFADKGFLVIDEPGHAGLVAVVTSSREEVGTASVKASPGAMGAAFSGLSGAVGTTMTVTLPTAQTMIVPLQRTRLEVRMRKRGDDAVLWQGAAITVRPAATQERQDKLIASDLIAAILRDYPAIPGNVISVP